MSFQIIDAAQRSPEWFAARAGRVTGSKAAIVMMKDLKSGGEPAAKTDYRLQLAVERLTGMPEQDDFTNKYMEHGTETEPSARMALEASRGILIRETGFIAHDSLPVGVSLDGDVDDLACLVELKCPKSTTHIGYLEAGVLPPKYAAQVMHGLFVTGAKNAIFASFDNRLPPALQLFAIDVKADSLPMEEYEKALTKFLAEVSILENKLRDMQHKFNPLKEAA